MQLYCRRNVIPNAWQRDLKHHLDNLNHPFMKRNPCEMVSILIMITILLSLILGESCDHPKPIPTNKKEFIGLWVSVSGFQLEIKSNGTANVTQIMNSQVPDYNRLNIKVAPPFIEDMLVTFKDDSILTISKPLNYA
jgi:hypothetical protein